MSTVFKNIDTALKPLLSTLKKMLTDPPYILREISTLAIRMLVLGAIMLLAVLCVQLILNIVKRRKKNVITTAITMCVLAYGLFFAYTPRPLPLPKLPPDSGYIIKGDDITPLKQNDMFELIEILRGKTARITLGTKMPQSLSNNKSHLKLVLTSAADEINVNLYDNKVYFDKNTKRSLLLALDSDNGELYSAISALAK